MALLIPNSFASKTSAQLSELDENFNYVASQVDSTNTNLQTASLSLIPSGAIIMWSGSIAQIPLNWYLCDGTNETPDLRDRFIIGASQDVSDEARTNVTGTLTKTGGSKDAILVSHTHTATVTDPGHNHTIPSGNNDGSDTRTDTSNNNTGTISTNSATTGITVANSTEGVSGNNANLPPYFALAFIMFKVPV